MAEEKTDREVLDHWASVCRQFADAEELLAWLANQPSVHIDLYAGKGASRSLKELLYEYFEVDYWRLEEARSNLLDEVRKIHGS